ncbi:MAG: tellurite methyltransferase [Polaribacter sp.]|jgi:tellurite methyltransferase
MLTFTNKNDFYALTQSAIIDLRSNCKFTAQHFKHSCNIELSSLENRLHELPESSQIISIIGEDNELQIASDFLIKKGYEILFRVEAKTEATSDVNSDTTSFFKIYNEFDWFESGKTSYRLWKPSSVVSLFHDQYAHLIADNTSVVKNSLKGLDLACGAGRDSVFMAMQCWDMTAVDYKSSALLRVKSLAENNDCDVKTVELDLEKIELNATTIQFPSAWLWSYDVVIVSRYLHRPLLDYIDALLKPNGFIVYQTFLEGCEKFGSPKNPRYLLKQGELASVFSSYKVLYDQVVKLSDGRPTNAFIAQKQNAIDILS